VATAKFDALSNQGYDATSQSNLTERQNGHGITLRRYDREREALCGGSPR